MSNSDLIFARRDIATVASSLRDLSNGGNYTRRMPDIIDAPSYIYDSVMKHVGLEVVPPKAYVAEIEDAIVRPPGFIYTKDFIINDCLVNFNGIDNLENWMPVRALNENSYSAQKSDFACERHIERPSVLLAQNSDVNYGHWIIECLPKVDLVSELYDVKDLLFIINYPNQSMNQVYYDSLQILGINTDQIVHLAAQPTCFSRLIYPGPVTSHPWITSPRTVGFLKQLCETLYNSNQRNSYPQRVYLTRNQIGRRRFINEDQIKDILEKYGFVSVSPEQLTFRQQVAVMSNASIVVGNLGGALSNIVFSPDRLTVIALSTEYMADDFFFDIVTQKSGHYISIHGKATDPSLGMQSDFSLDPNIFADRLAKTIESNDESQSNRT